MNWGGGVYQTSSVEFFYDDGCNEVAKKLTMREGEGKGDAFPETAADEKEWRSVRSGYAV